VDGGESFHDAAVREVREETLIDVKLVGVLNVQWEPMGDAARMRVIFLGEPADPDQAPKSEPDDESEGAAWHSLDELRALGRASQLRGREPLSWAEYVEGGGVAAPLSILGPESFGSRPAGEPAGVTVDVAPP